jgi:hypothetical protein
MNEGFFTLRTCCRISADSWKLCMHPLQFICIGVLPSPFPKIGFYFRVLLGLQERAHGAALLH